MKEQTFDDFVDWAAGYILKELIAGRFCNSVFMVCDCAIRWRMERGDINIVTTKDGRKR